MMELKPCPFCGNKPEVSEHGPLIDGEPGIAIWCVSGDCRMDDVGGMNFDSEEQAIKAWNTRTPDKSTTSSSVVYESTTPHARLILDEE
jgi:Lar family restriction alleviation protein